MSVLTSAANEYFGRGWTPLALGLDDYGKPKRPLATAWTSIPRTAAAVRDQPWDSACGIGIALGHQSNGLAAIDIDDVEMAAEVFAILVRGHVDTRIVFTPRRHLHVFCIEDKPSHSSKVPVLYKGRRVQIELKATGNQVASPPTEGYTLSKDSQPVAAPTVGDVWQQIAKRLEVEEIRQGGSRQSGMVWAERVPRDYRNNTLYIEAHNMREARIPLASALELLSVRWERRYEQGEMSWQEAERTIRSAYRKGTPDEAWENRTNERYLLP